MFRGKKPSDLNPKNFGAGSRIEGAPSESWLVICNDDRVGLIDLQTFRLVEGSIAAEDPNYLTESQTRELVQLIDNNYTFSDYDFHPAGFKEVKFVANNGPIQ